MENITNTNKRRFISLASFLAVCAASATTLAGQGDGLRPFTFPDGTGSIGLAPGWQTNAQTATRGIMLSGPDGERLFIRNTFSILMPNNPAARVARGRAMIAPPASPLQALAELGPQLSQNSEMHGGPALTFDGFTQLQARQSSLLRGSAAVVMYSVTETSRFGRRHYRSRALIETAPAQTPGWWLMRLTEARAPDAAFDRDFPGM